MGIGNKEFEGLFIAVVIHSNSHYLIKIFTHIFRIPKKNHLILCLEYKSTQNV